MSNQLPVINLMGPTASGKTALACELYEQGHFELISVDSALVYREMDIGTAKPSKEELERYPHHLIDIISPLEVYSAANFVEDACRLIDDIHARGKTPILVGGTMLYFKALLEGLSDNCQVQIMRCVPRLKRKPLVKGGKRCMLNYVR